LTPLLTVLTQAGIVAGFVALLQWVAVYSYQENWWRHQLGSSLVAKTLLIASLLFLTLLGVFFNLNRRDNLGVAWAAVVLIWLVTPVMAWRTVVWTRIYLAGPRAARRRARRAARRGVPVPVPVPEGPFAMAAAGSKLEVMRALLAVPPGGPAAASARDVLLDVLSGAPGAAEDGRPFRYEAAAAGDPGGVLPSLDIRLAAQAP
jgi:hypothetical protein